MPSPIRKIKLWWRFVEADPSVDQEFFFQLPNRKAAIVARSESGGFRTTSGEGDTAETLLIQGTSHLSEAQLASAIASWITRRRSRVTVELTGGAALAYGGLVETEFDSLSTTIKNDLIELLDGAAGPLRVSAIEIRADEARPQLTSKRSAPASAQDDDAASVGNNSQEDDVGHTPPDPLVWHMDQRPDDALLLKRVLKLDIEHQQKALFRIRQSDPSLGRRLTALVDAQLTSESSA